MTENEFINKYASSFNSEQLEAVKTTEGALLLLAVPGAGKTTTLVTRLGYMCIVKGITPSSILSLTYTVAAAKEMCTRFGSLYGEDIADQIEFRTINGICAKILAHYSSLIGKKSPTLITDEGSITKILSDIYVSIVKDYPTESDIKEIRTQITFAKNRLLTSDEIKDLQKNMTSEAPILTIYEKYNKHLKDNKMMDYDDQMVYAYGLLKKVPDLLKFYQNKYAYISVDEAQDTSKIQHLIIELLSQGTNNIFMVGDDDQSIYGFRGSDPTCLMDFEKTYKNAKVLVMSKNYRSSANIVAAADNLIQHNRQRRGKHIESTHPAYEDINYVELERRDAHNDYLLRDVCCTKGKTAILYRDNESILPLVDLLLRNSIPYYMRNTDATFFSHRVTRDVISFLQYAINPFDQKAFMNIYYKCNSFLKKNEALKLCDYSKKIHMPIFECVKCDDDISDSVYDKCLEIHEAFYKLRSSSPIVAINYITTVLGYEDYLDRNHLSDNKVEILKQLSTSEKTIESFLQRLTYLYELIRDKTPNYSANLVLTTIHSAKGLEWDNVYIIDAIDGVFPSITPPINASKEEMATFEEERRLFYVAMTRAKKNLTIFKYIGMHSTFVADIKRPYIERPATKIRKELGPVDIPVSINEGDEVVHSSFGFGVIVEAPSSNDTIFKVRFDIDRKIRMFSFPSAFEKHMRMA